MSDFTIFQGANYNRDFFSKKIKQSLRFNDDDDAYLVRTPGEAGNLKTWTLSMWFKRGNLGIEAPLWYASVTASSPYDEIRFETDDTMNIYSYSGSYQWRLATKQKFRDTSAWYHIVVQLDTPNESAKVYINGVQIQAADLNTNTQPSLNYEGGTNSTNGHGIGMRSDGTGNEFDGCIAEVHFIDGQALGPEYFAVEENGVWVPITPPLTTENYGTNGFHLEFNAQLPSFTADYLVVGGGGGGGRGGGGGGAGGFREFTGATLYKGYAYPLTVGAGGAGSSSYTENATSGGDSTFVVTSAGGGGGQSHDSGVTAPSGGSGGGAGSAGTSKTGGSGNTPSTSPSQGNNGGNNSTAASAYGAGGGGGAGAVGANGTSTSGGNGGAGSTSTIDSNTYAGGGGGTGRGTNDGTGGSSIGGDAGNTGNGGDAVASTGSGGGGTGFNAGGNQGGSGSDGIILIKIPDSVTATFTDGVTRSSSTAGGYTTYTVTATSGLETVEFS